MGLVSSLIIYLVPSSSSTQIDAIGGLAIAGITYFVVVMISLRLKSEYMS